jgi:hypothetical protein
MGGYVGFPNLAEGEYVVFLNIDGYQIQRNFRVK